MNTKWRDKLRGRIDKTVRRYRQVEAELGESPASVCPGDLFLFDVPVEILLEWVVIFPHPDEVMLWFVVPADQNPMLGTADVEVPEFAKCGPLTLRCGRGLWIHVDDLDLQMRSGRLEPEYVDQVQDKLSVIVGGRLTPSRFQEEVESDVEYEYWLGAVTQAVDWLERKLQCPVEPDTIVLHASDFSQNWYQNLHARSKAETLTVLAADSGGMQAIPEASTEPPAGAIVLSDMPGELVALKYRDGVVVEYFPDDDEEPTELYRENAVGKPQHLPWKQTPDGNAICSELLRWESGSVIFFVDSGEGPKVTIEQ